MLEVRHVGEHQVVGDMMTDEALLRLFELTCEVKEIGQEVRDIREKSATERKHVRR